MDGNKKTRNYKLVLLGDTSVGKSSITNRFIRDEFYEFSEPTIGAAFTTKTLELESRKIRFEIWDTAGQERYRSLAPMYYRGATAAVVVYDITQIDTFRGAEIWVNELFRKVGNDIIVALVGNKLDLKEEKKIFNEKLDLLLENFNDKKLYHMEVSAKNGENIKELFDSIAKKCPFDGGYSDKNSPILNNNIKIVNKRNCC
jgi:small GTP-binding protein